MAIGTATAILASAAIGGGTALISGAQQSRAASQAAGAATNAANQTDATNRYIFDATRQDNALNREVGNAATQQLARIMGLSVPMPGQPASYAPQTNALNPAARLPNYTKFVGTDGPLVNGGPSDGYAPAPQPQTPATGQPVTGQAGAQQPYDVTAWLRSTPGYDANFREGQRSMNLALANRGQLLSGDAAREAIRYGQNYGDRIFNQERNALFNLAGYGQVANQSNAQAGQAYAGASANNNWNRAQQLGSSYQNSANAWTNALGGVAGAGLWAANNWPGSGGAAAVNQNALRGYMN